MTKNAPGTGRKPRVGDTSWFVEWCSKVGKDEDGEWDRDNDVTHTRQAATKEEAERIAREVYPRDRYGSVAYWPAEFVAYDPADAARYPTVGYWNATADEAYYDGDD